MNLEHLSFCLIYWDFCFVIVFYLGFFFKGKDLEIWLLVFNSLSKGITQPLTETTVSK